MEFQGVGAVKVKAKAPSPTVRDLVLVKVCNGGDQTGTRGEVIQSFAGDEEDR